MGRSSPKKRGSRGAGLPANHWTYHDPDRHLWTPSELAQARQVPTRGVWEALYGGGGGGPLKESSLQKLRELLAKDSPRFIREYRQSLRPGICEEDIGSEALLGGFIKKKLANDNLPESLPEDWPEYFRGKCIQALLGEDNFFADNFSLEAVLLLYNWREAKQFFHTQSQAFLDEIEEAEIHKDRAKLCQVVEGANRWLRGSVMPATYAFSIREDIFTSEEPGEPLPLLAARVQDLMRSEGAPPFSQNMRQDWIIEKASSPGDALSQDWVSRGDWSRMPGITLAYRLREADRIEEREAELTAATLYAVIRGDTRFETLWSLQEAIERDIEKTIEGGQKPDLLRLTPLLRYNDLAAITRAMDGQEELPQKIAAALVQAGKKWNASARDEMSGPGASLSLCLREAFRSASK